MNTEMSSTLEKLLQEFLQYLIAFTQIHIINYFLSLFQNFAKLLNKCVLINAILGSINDCSENEINIICRKV